MPQLDSCHPQVVKALEKVGWSVTPDPFVLLLDKIHRLYIDIEAYRPSDRRTIMIVEVKCFHDTSDETTDLYLAIGQYMIYRGLLEQRNIEAPLYLAVPESAYRGVFQRMAMPVVHGNHVKMILVDLDREVIKQWIE